MSTQVLSLQMIFIYNDCCDDDARGSFISMSFFNFVQNDVKRMKDTRTTCEIYSFLKPKCFFQQIDEEVIDRSSKVTTNDTLARKIQKTLT